MSVIWVPVKGFNGYEVNNFGVIRSKFKELKPYINRYARIGLSRNGKRKQYLVHRIVASSFFNVDIESEMEVNHINGDKLDNRPCNLEWCSRSENQKHAYKKGLNYSNAPKGKKHHNARLSGSDVLEIRKLCRSGISQADVARKFNVSYQHVWDIINYKRWKHVA